MSKKADAKKAAAIAAAVQSGAVRVIGVPVTETAKEFSRRADANRLQKDASGVWHFFSTNANSKRPAQGNPEDNGQPYAIQYHGTAEVFFFKTYTNGGVPQFPECAPEEWLTGAVGRDAQRNAVTAEDLAMLAKANGGAC